MINNNKWEKAAKKRKIVALSLTIIFHLTLIAFLYSGGDFSKIKEKFQTEEVKQKA